MRRRDHDQVVAELRGRIRYLERQNDTLLDRLMYASDKTWTPPPPMGNEPLEPLPDYNFSPDAPLDVFAGEE